AWQRVTVGRESATTKSLTLSSAHSLREQLTLQSQGNEPMIRFSMRGSPVGGVAMPRLGRTLLRR
ncbi:MAG: hypothetical protein ACREX8_21655, partial [Gammaproteobacteria bacterium]